MIRRYKNCKKKKQVKWTKPLSIAEEQIRLCALLFHSKVRNIKVGLFILFSRITLSRIAMKMLVERESNHTWWEKNRGRIMSIGGQNEWEWERKKKCDYRMNQWRKASGKEPSDDNVRSKIRWFFYPWLITRLEPHY